MLSLKIVLCGFIIVLSQCVYANNLVVTLDGNLNKSILSNIHSHLGHLPKSALERSAYIYSAKDNANNALQALGYYQAEVIANVVKGKGNNDKEKENSTGKENTEKTNTLPWQLILTITLNKPTLIDKVDIKIVGEANEDLAFKTFLKEHAIKQGDILNHGQYEALKSDLVSLALQRGYFDGELVENKIAIKDQYHFADITLHYKSGPRYQFGDVNFNDFDLEPWLLSSLIPFKKNEYYSTPTFHQLQNQLQSTQYFGSVVAIPGEKNEDKVNHTIPINVLLTPAKSHQFDFGIGYATDTEFRLSAAWRTPLINKYGHFQETKLEYSKLNPIGQFIYSIPLAHPVNDLFQFKVTVKNDEYVDITTKQFSTQIGRVVRKNNWQRQLYIRFHQESWHYDLNDDSPNIDWGDLDTADYLIPGITWSKTNRSGSPLDPSFGFRQTYNIEGAHLNAGSDNTFFRLHGRWSYITTLQPKHRLVTRAELGAIYVDSNVDLAPSLRFYAGGDNSIRGFAYRTIGSTVPSSSNPEESVPVIVGGTRLMVGSIEYQYYITEQWRMALFSDAGSVANKGEFEPVYSVGSGLHYMSPVGAIKLDVAYGIDGDDTQWRLHINLGAEL